jgi:hypothetical protein
LVNNERETMERRNAIAVAAASAGVLITGTVAGVAVVNAATSWTESDDTTLTVAAPAASVQVLQPTALRMPEADALPTIVVPTADESTIVVTPRIARGQAADLVAAATGGTVLKTTPTTHNGYEAYAVQVERTDGSIITGMVESGSGVIYDWRVNKEAPPAPAYQDDDYDDHESDEHEEEHEGDDDDD